MVTVIEIEGVGGEVDEGTGVRVISSPPPVSPIRFLRTTV